MFVELEKLCKQDLLEAPKSNICLTLGSKLTIEDSKLIMVIKKWKQI